jgi:aminoglycoside phosphotransferase (APT) family kinase protein
MTDDCIQAILIAPQLERFRALCDLDGVRLTTNFDGWHRHAVLAPDRVFLFPRGRSWVPGLRREMVVLKALDGRGVPAARLLGHWHDRDVSPYPFIAVSRLPGRPWSRLESTATLEQVTTLLEALGRTIASWHRLSRTILPERLPRHQDDAERFLTTTLEVAAHDVAGRLGLPRQRASAWLQELEPLAALAPVLVHGDLHEGQILVDDDLRVTGILDWESAHLGNPLKDFDFGEWGYGIFAWDRHFARLHRHLWEAYATARGGTLPSWRTVHLFFCLSWAHGLGQRPALDDWGRARLATTLDQVRRLEAMKDPHDVRAPEDLPEGHAQ